MIAAWRVRMHGLIECRIDADSASETDALLVPGSVVRAEPYLAMCRMSEPRDVAAAAA